jgi:hypothetical protein
MCPLLLALAWVFPAAQVPQPAAQDLIFVGRGLSDLRSAVHPSVARIALHNEELIRDLGAMLNNPPPVPVAALIVPRDAGAANPIVRLAYNNGKTALYDLTVPAVDIDQLRGVVRDGLVLFLLREDFGGNQSPQMIAELKKKIDALPASERPQARLYAGAVLADRGVDHAEAAGMIEEFHKAARKDLDGAILDAARRGALESGKPYAIGSHPITESQLASIPADKVGDVHIDGHDFKGAWVGASLVIVKPAADTAVTPVPPKNGIDRFQLNPEEHHRFTRGGAGPSRTIHNVPGRKK